MNKAVTIDENLIGLVKSIKNRAEIFLIICADSEAPNLVATLLEDMFADVQEIITYCEVKE